MNTIENYVETMFINLSETEELISIKKDILDNMEEKYETLKKEGLTENEAIGLIISEFGNIDEILEELSIEKKDHLFKSDDFSTMTTNDIDIYLGMKKEISTGVGMGVILSGIATAVLLLGIYWDLFIIGLIIALVIVVGAVSLFISNGLRHSQFNYLEKGFFISSSDKMYVNEQSKKFRKSFNLALIIGISLCILSVIPVIIGSQWTSHILIYISLTVVIATMGVFFLIYGGSVKAGFTYLLENGIDDSISEDELANKLFWKKFNEKYWLVIVALYLFFSFIFNLWSISWILFPIAGVLSGIWVDNQN